jgi:hypothetical protein
MASLFAVMAYELRWLPRRLGGWRGITLYLGFLVVLGYLFPTALGLSFLDPHILLAYACSAPFFVSSVAVEAFAAGDEAPPRSLLAGKLVALTAFGWATSVVALAAGLASVNLREWHGSAVMPDTRLLTGLLALGLSLALFTVAAAAVLCLYVSPPQSAKSILRRTFFIALLAVVLLARYGEVEWKDSFTALLLPDSILRFAIGGMLVFDALSVGLLIVALRHPRYSGPVSSS